MSWGHKKPEEYSEKLFKSTLIMKSQIWGEGNNSPVKDGGFSYKPLWNIYTFLAL